ncbi:hypothetical protein F5X97DRAFT_313266 [Nemania serpens]|nr:hypothetical protein F5X97DRAFT_313266 [Nemania serpens]
MTLCTNCPFSFVVLSSFPLCYSYSVTFSFYCADMITCVLQGRVSEWFHLLTYLAPYVPTCHIDIPACIYLSPGRQ